MRMRKKKHLEERIADRKDNLFVYQSKQLDFSLTEERSFIDLEQYFGNKNPVQMEVGCGKGSFIVQLALMHPDINYIAVEYCANVIIVAAEAAAEKGIKNILFINGNAEYLPRLIHPHTVDRIYLNFSCPFPKNKYAGHRLTNVRFLNIYRQLMTDGADIHQKTDNRPFFDYSISQYAEAGFSVTNVTYDLANSGFEGNIMTEYESRFTAMGIPICRLEAKKAKMN